MFTVIVLILVQFLLFTTVEIRVYSTNNFYIICIIRSTESPSAGLRTLREILIITLILLLLILVQDFLIKYPVFCLI